MLITDPFPPTLPATLAERFTTRVPIDADVPVISALVHADMQRMDADARVDERGLASRLVGLRSWSRRQVVVVPAAADGSPSADAPIAWVSCEDRGPGRVNVQWAVHDDAPEREALTTALLDWADGVGATFARHRGVEKATLNAGCRADDAQRRAELTSNGFRHVRTWLHMERPVAPDEAQSTPGPREGVRVRTVSVHDSGLPVAQDVRTIHRMLEESFADHFNSYRESFPEFIHRMTDLRAEVNGLDWSLWWIAEFQQGDGTWRPGGGLVATPMQASAHAGEGTYLEYLGVHRSARGRGVAKALLNAALVDAAERGRTRLGLEVDDDSPTGADGLYRSLGFETTEVTESWFRDVAAEQPGDSSC